MEQSEHAYQNNISAGNMLVNRFCIDEDASFELIGVELIQDLSFTIISLIAVIDSIFKKNIESNADDMETHFVYPVEYYFDDLESAILEKMKKYNIKKIMVTIIYMQRNHLITKESMNSYTNGEEDVTESINDDFESLFEDLRLGKEPVDCVETYFLPKLTQEELKLVDQEDEIYLESFTMLEPDVHRAELIASESRSKFVLGLGWRETLTIENSSKI